MKGKMKKLAAFALAAIMVLAMGMTAFANENTDVPEGETSKPNVTIDGTEKDTVYSIYKIFNVTPNGNVALYSRPKTTPLVGDYTTVFTQVDNGSTDYYYNQTKGFTESAFVSYLSDNKSKEGFALESKTATVEEGKTSIDLTLTPGYYFIVSSQGATVILRAVAEEHITVSEKNIDTDWGDDGGKKSLKWDATAKDGAGDWVEGSYYHIGETVKYEVNYNAAQNFTKKTTVTGDGTKTGSVKVTKYVAQDTMPVGVSYKENSIAITVNGKPLVKDATIKVTKNQNNQDVISIEIPWSLSEDAKEVGDFYYSAPAQIKITYEATVTKDVNSQGQAITNTIKIAPNEITDTTEEKENKIYTGSLQVKKYDESVEGAKFDVDTKLAGAKFVIIDTPQVTTDTKYLHKADDGTISWGAQEGCIELETDADGVSEVVNGLEQGTYYLLETKAPTGFNLANAPIAVQIAKNDSGQDITAENVTVTDLNKTPEIGNRKGSLLPSTGGIGTTIFYVVGGILVVGAGILLITKKRMSKQQ